MDDMDDDAFSQLAADDIKFLCEVIGEFYANGNSLGAGVHGCRRPVDATTQTVTHHTARAEIETQTDFESTVPAADLTVVAPCSTAKRAKRSRHRSPSPAATSNRFTALDVEMADPADCSEAAATSTAKTTKRVPQTRKPRERDITIHVTLPQIHPKPAKPAVRLPTQCFACQGFGHRAADCTSKPRCVRCSGPHAASACERPRDQPATCANCCGPHPASYRGCAEWKAATTTVKNTTAKPSTRTRPVCKLPSHIVGRRAQIVSVCEQLTAQTLSTEVKMLLAVIPQLLTASSNEMTTLINTMAKANGDEQTNNHKTPN